MRFYYLFKMLHLKTHTQKNTVVYDWPSARAHVGLGKRSREKPNFTVVQASLISTLLFLTGTLPEGFRTSPVFTSQCCGSSFKTGLESAHFSPSMGTVWPGCHPLSLAHSTSLFPPSILPSRFHTDLLLLPPLTPTHWAPTTGLLAIYSSDSAGTACLGAFVLALLLPWNTLPPDIALGASLPPTHLTSSPHGEASSTPGLK